MPSLLFAGIAAVEVANRRRADQRGDLHPNGHDQISKCGREIEAEERLEGAVHNPRTARTPSKAGVLILDEHVEGRIARDVPPATSGAEAMSAHLLLPPEVPGLRQPPAGRDQKRCRVIWQTTARLGVHPSRHVDSAPSRTEGAP